MLGHGRPHSPLAACSCLPACVRAPGRCERRRDRRSRRRRRPPGGQQQERRARLLHRARRSSATSSTGAPSTGPRSSVATTRAAGRARWPTTSASPTAARCTRARSCPPRSPRVTRPTAHTGRSSSGRGCGRLRRRQRAGRALHLALARQHRRAADPDRSATRQAPASLGFFTFHGCPVFGTKWTKRACPWTSWAATSTSTT